MNGDEMVFEEVSYREPERQRRPDRDRRWASLAYEAPGPDDLPIYLDKTTADAIERHALSDTRVELGGILLGKECVDTETGTPFVWVTKALEAKHYENTQASFTYTHDSWGEITRERDERYPDLDIVGWYHTHPDFGIFLSGHDLFIHHHFFNRPLQVAYVVDPIRQHRGFFQWRGDEVDQVAGFFLTCDRADRVATARLLNDLEGLPNPEGGAGMLSPRLESELIAMLSRPHTYAPSGASAVDRAQTAALFMMIGTALGVLAVVAGLWLYQLHKTIEGQADELQKLTAALDRAEERKTVDVSLAGVRAKQAALDSLLREVKPGASPEAFTELYAAALRDRDEAQNKLAEQRAAADLALRNSVEKETLFEAERKRADSLKKLADDAATYRDANKKHEADNKSLKEKLDEQDATLQTLKDVKSGDLPRKYQIAWYAAAVGWGLCILAGLGLLSLMGRTPPLPPSAAGN